MQAQQQIIQKQVVEEFFTKIFQDEANKKCVNCNGNSRQWISVNNAIFLCLNCAAECKDVRQSICQIKSINLGIWTQRQLKFIEFGGNKRFQVFMQKYKLNGLHLQYRLCTRAGVYYRQMLSNLVQGIQPQQQPNYDAGREIVIDNSKKTKQQSKEQDDYLEIAKQKLIGAYEITKQLTVKAATKIETKLKSPEFQKDVSDFKQKSKQIGRSIKKASKQGYYKAKEGFSVAWSALSNQIQQLMKN